MRILNTWKPLAFGALLAGAQLPGTIAAESPEAEVLSQEGIRAITQRVADWQIANIGWDFDRRYKGASRLNAWTYGAMYVGMCKWAEASQDQRYYDFLKSIGEELDWTLLGGRFHADHQIVGYAYLDLYEKYGDERMKQAIAERLDSLVVEPSDRPIDIGEKHNNFERWTWCDALFMAPPVWAKLFAVTGDAKYRDWMFEEYQAVASHLFDEEESLFFRDSRFFDQRSEGEKIFWSRGNGWVFAGLPLVIELLDEGAPKDYFVDLLQKMAPRIAELQAESGLWPMSLLQGDLYATPETSGSAFFVYGLAWGVNRGLLERSRYGATIEKGWQALTRHVDQNGFLGYVQPIGAEPGQAWPDKSEVYGVGAFLMAGTEMLVYAQGE